MKKIAFAIPAIAAVSSFAQTTTNTPSWATADNVNAATSGLVEWGGLIVAGIGGVIMASSGLRLLVKGVNRAVGK